MGPVLPGLIGIELTGHDGQWHDAVVEDNEIGAAIPIKILDPPEVFPPAGGACRLLAHPCGPLSCTAPRCPRRT
jgi:hypothetical protein